MNSQKDCCVYVNGEYYSREDAKISVFDQGLIFGDGVYDTMVAKNGFIFKLDEHIDRLSMSAKAIRIELPLSKEKLKAVIVETVRRTELKDAYVKCIVTRGIGKKPVLGRGDVVTPTVIAFAVPPVSVVSLEKVEKGARLISTTIKRMPHQTLDPRVKSLNYLPNMLMRLQAIEAGADEALSYDYEGHITEGGAENVFIVKGNVLQTPSSGILKGITRATIMEIAKSKGYDVKVTNLTQYDVYTADELFLCSTAGGIFPITMVDGIAIGDGRVGKITRQMLAAYEEMLAKGTHGTPIYKNNS